MAMLRVTSKTIQNRQTRIIANNTKNNNNNDYKKKNYENNDID